MVIPITILTLLENTMFSLVFGFSTVAVFFYILSLRHSFPSDAFGKSVVNLVYYAIRGLHTLLLVIVILYFLIFGILDNVGDVFVIYGIKSFILLLNLLFAFLLYKKMYPKFSVAAIASGWYFLMVYHSYSTFVGVSTFWQPLVWYILFMIFFQVLFKLFRLYIPVHEK